MADAGAAVFLGNGRAQQTHLAHLGHDLAVEALLAEGGDDARLQLFLTIGRGRITDQNLVLGQLAVDEEGVVPFELLHGVSLPVGYSH